jgi:serine protease Do
MTVAVLLTLLPVAQAGAQLRGETPQSLTELSDSFEDLVSTISPAVVQIFASGYAPVGLGETTGNLLAERRSGGSGVILDPNGYIITNAHVVDGARRLQVTLPVDDPGKIGATSILRPRGRRIGAQLIGVDRETDLAVIKVPAKNLPYLTLSDSDNVRQGQIVLAFGSPYGLQNSVSMGVVSSVARQMSPDNPMIYIQTDATINPGNSGGPLLDTHGNVIGINTLILTQSGGSDGVGFAAPSNIVKNIYNQLRASGRVRRGQIGINAQTITPALAAALQLPKDWGVIVGDVVPRSPAARAGLQVGDIVVAMNGKPMENGRQLDVNLYRRSEGDEVALQILRNGEPQTITVSVIERQNDTTRFMDLVNPARNVIQRLGILCLDIDDNVARMLRQPRLKPGVLVADRADNAPAGRGGLRQLDIIYTINGKHVSDLDELRREVDRLQPGDPVACQIERDGRLMYVSFEIDL